MHEVLIVRYQLCISSQIWILKQKENIKLFNMFYSESYFIPIENGKV